MRTYHHRYPGGQVTGYSDRGLARVLRAFWYGVFGTALLGWPIAVVPGWWRWAAEVIWLAVCVLLLVFRAERGPGPKFQPDDSYDSTSGPGPRDWTPVA